jgi:hypothetical protein
LFKKKLKLKKSKHQAQGHEASVGRQGIKFMPKSPG